MNNVILKEYKEYAEILEELVNEIINDLIAKIHKYEEKEVIN